MTVTDAPAPPASAAPPGPAVRPAPTGLADWLTTGDHKKSGRLLAVLAVVAGLGALGVLGALRLEMVDDSGTQFLQDDAVAQLVALFRYGLPFLVVAPLLLGVATAVVPLQIGARSIAFPRAAAFAVWTWLAGAVLFVVAFAVNGGPGGGESDGVELFLGAMMLLVLSLGLLCVCLATTVLTLRAPGMTLGRVPFFSWSVLASASMLLMVLAAVLANLALLWVDYTGARVVFGGNAGIDRYLSWSVSQPTVWLYALPMLGFVADVAVTFSKRRPAGAPALFVALGLGAALGFGAFAQPAFVPDVIDDFVLVVVSLGGIVAPLATLALAGMWLGKPVVKAPVVWALATALMAFVGGAVGVLLPIEGLELRGTVYELSLYNYVLLAGLLGGLGGLVYWGPKLWGRRLPDGPALGLAGLGLVGVVLVAFPDVIAGFLDQPFGAVDDLGDSGALQILNIASFAGVVVLVVVVLALLALALTGFRGGPAAGDDPWEGATLEWATTSPPPDGNFATAPAPVRSAQPLLDAREESAP